MPAHNNAIQRPHLRKHYAKWVKTWFNQPARKNRRLQKRKEKAASIFPRPLRALRPVVHKTTARYSGQPRVGRGFTLEEIKKAGLNAAFARTIGIAVDHRRTNKSVESVQRNVNRLKAFIEKLVLLPKTAGKPKKGRNGVLSDSTEAPQLVQNIDKAILGKPEIKLREKPIAITKELKEFRAYRQLRLERTNQKWAGKRALKTETAKE